MNTEIFHQKMPYYASIVLRISVALLYIWFGIQQLTNAASWTYFLPSWSASLPLDQITLIHLNGAFELVMAVALIIGFQTRLTAFLLSIHMAAITIDIGYNAIGVRDFVIFAANFSIFLFGPDKLTLDYKLEKKQ